MRTDRDAQPDAEQHAVPVGIAVFHGDPHPGTELDFYPDVKPLADGDAHVAAYWGADTDWDAPADGDGNPLPDRIRRELTTEQARIDAYFRSGGLTSL